MTLILSNDDTEALLTMPDYLTALENAYKDLAEGAGIAGPRADMSTVTENPESIYQLKMMGGMLPNAGYGSIRINSDIINWPQVGGKVRRQKIPLAPGDRWTGLILMFDINTSEPVAIIPDGAMQPMRVAATSGLGVKYLAREDSEIVGLIGSGRQAESQVLAVTSVRDIKEVRCYSMTKENRERFCKTVSQKVGVSMTPVASPEEAARGADIVLLATNSLDPIFFKPMIEPGVHLGTIREMDMHPDAMRAADVIVMHDPIGTDIGNFFETHGVENKDQAGQSAVDRELSSLKNVPNLIELIGGQATGRTSAEQVSCFLNFRGLGIQFTAVGAMLIEKARAAGRGNELPTEWFTEDVCP